MLVGSVVVASAIGLRAQQTPEAAPVLAAARQALGGDATLSAVTTKVDSRIVRLRRGFH